MHVCLYALPVVVVFAFLVGLGFGWHARQDALTPHKEARDDRR